jgi:hypothetical protein
MNTKTAITLLILLLSWAMIGGCPTTVDGTDSLDDLTPTDSVDTSDGDDSTPGDSDSDDGSSDDGSSDSPDDGSDDPVDDDGTDDGDDSNPDDNGDDSNPDDSGDPALSGSFSGNWTRVAQETALGITGPEQEWTTEETVTFGSDGIPTAFIVPGYMQTEGGIDFIAEVKQVGDSVTLEESADGLDYTLTVTVALASYDETTARVVLDLVHHGEDDEGSNDAETQDGTGVQVIEYSLVSGQLEYSSTTTYEVALFYGNIDTIWDISCEGTLAPE